MAEVTRWRDLTIGLLALGAIGAIVLGVLTFAEVGGIRGRKVTLYVAADETGGLLPGSDVYLSGKRVGKVESIVFRPPSTDTTERLLIRAAVLRRALPLIRKDSPVNIGPVGTFLGTPVLGIGAGSATARQARPGDTLYAAAFRQSEGVMAQLATVGRDFGALKEEVTAVLEDMKTARGTFGAMAIEGPRDIGRVGADFSRFHARLTRGGGTIGRVMNDPKFGRRFSAIRSDVDSLRLLVTSERGTVGRFRRDATLGASVQSLRDEVASLQRSLDDARGTAGRAMNDKAVQDELAELGRQLDELMADIKKNPFRYIRL